MEAHGMVEKEIVQLVGADGVLGFLLQAPCSPKGNSSGVMGVAQMSCSTAAVSPLNSASAAHSTR